MEQPPSESHLVWAAPTRDERTWAMLCHILAIPALPFMLGHIIVPLIIWLIKREGSPFVDDQGKEAVNFQITFSIALFVPILLIHFCIGFILLPVVVIGWIVLTMTAALRANAGIAYRYPVSIRFIK